MLQGLTHLNYRNEIFGIKFNKSNYLSDNYRI